MKILRSDLWQGTALYNLEMRKKLIILSLLLIAVLACILVFYIFSQPPKDQLSAEFKEKAIADILGRKANINPEKVASGNKEFEGKYVRFSYPAKVAIYEYRNNTQSSVLEDFSFDLSSPKTVFNMTVNEGNTGILTLGDIPSVRLREDRGYEYEAKKIEVNGISGMSFFKGGMQAEKSGFFLTGGKIYSFSVTGSSEKEVVKLFDDVIKTASFLDGGE